MHLRESYEWSRGVRQGSLESRPATGWGVLRRDMTPTAGARRHRLQREMSTGALPGSKKNEFVLYRERWLMLGIVSALVCVVVCTRCVCERESVLCVCVRVCVSACV